MVNKGHNISCKLLAEFLFTILPIIVVLIIRLSQSDYSALFYNTEWGFASVIFYGQSIIKLASGGSATLVVQWERIALGISILLVIGLIPSIVVFCLNFTSTNNSFGLYFVQFVELIFSIISFFTIGAVGDMMLDDK